MCRLAYPHPVLPHPNPQAEYIIVGEAPGYSEVANGEYFCGRSGKLLWKVLEDLGFSKKDFFVTNALKCLVKNPRIQEINECRKWLVHDILSCPNRKLIIAIGDTAMKALRVPESRGITAASGKRYWLSEFNCECLCVIHPASVLRSPRKYSLFRESLQNILERKRQLPEPRVERLSLSNWKTFLAFAKSAERIACDIETFSPTGDPEDAKNPYLAELGSIGFFFPNVCYVVGMESLIPLKEHLYDFFTTYPTVWHNAAYDVKVLYRFFGNRLIPISDDTLLMSYIVDEAKGSQTDEDTTEGGYSLEKTACLYLGVAPWKWLAKDPVKAAQKLNLTEEEVFTKYLAYDVRNTYYLWDTLRKRIPQDSPYYKLILPAFPVKTKMELRGILVDEERRKELLQQYLPIKDELLRKLQQSVPLEALEPLIQRKQNEFLLKEQKKFDASHSKVSLEKRKAKFKEKIDRHFAKIREKYSLYNPNSDEFNIAVFSYLLGKPLESVDREFLESVSDTIPLARQLLEYRMINKGVSTYLERLTFGKVGNKKGYVQSDGRVHFNFHLHRTVTGRLASSDPNGQNIPGAVYDEQGNLRFPSMRQVYIADPGWKLVSFDYSQLELKVMMVFADAKEVIEKLRNGWDMHLVTASFVTGKQDLKDITSQERSQAKRINFGIPYGLSEEELAKQLNCSIYKAREFKEKNFGFLETWRQSVIEKAVKERKVISVYGRERRFPLVTTDNFPEVCRQAVNHVVQSAASDLCLERLIECDRVIEEHGLTDRIYPIMTIHDDLKFMMRNDFITEGVKLVKEIMERPPFWSNGLSFTVEVKISDRW